MKKKPEIAFGEYLAQLYTRVGFTQEEFARKARVSSAAVRNWLRGGREGGHGISIEKLRAVIEVLLHAGAFTIGEEREEAEDLWHAASVKAAFDERWFRQLKQQMAANNTISSNNKTTQTSNTMIIQRDDQELQENVLSLLPSLFYFNRSRGLPRVEEFYGREQERTRLLLQTARQQSTSIVGPSKVGKTWLVDHFLLTAPQKLGNRFRIGSINALSHSCMTIEGFMVTAARQLSLSISPLYNQQGLSPLEYVVADLLEEDITPVLCIDSFDAFARREAFDEHFFGGLRALAQAGLCLVTTSKQQLIDIVVRGSRLSSLINIFDPIVLEAFTEIEATDFVQQKGAQASFSAEECQQLLHYSRVGDRWPPTRLQLAGEIHLWAKHWGHYRAHDPAYWQSFTIQLEERYRGVMNQ